MTEALQELVAKWREAENKPPIGGKKDYSARAFGVCADELEAALADGEPGLREILQKLVDKLDEIAASEEYRSVCFVAQIHRGNYTGPTWEAELKAARTALAQPAAAKQEEVSMSKSVEKRIAAQKGEPIRDFTSPLPGFAFAPRATDITKPEPWDARAQCRIYQHHINCSCLPTHPIGIDGCQCRIEFGAANGAQRRYQMNWCSRHGVNFKRDETCSLCTKEAAPATAQLSVTPEMLIEALGKAHHHVGPLVANCAAGELNALLRLPAGSKGDEGDGRQYASGI